MSTPRRQLIRPPTNPLHTLQRQRQIEKLSARLDDERRALARWQKRLRRAFTAVEKQNRTIARLERQIARQEE
jgi:hypothetical protein